jgi:MarR-like DNA-binding transcriptional regulator SgrR of sgrS sRNA
VQSSLKELMKGFDDYLKKRGIHLETIFINNDQLGNYLQQDTSIKFLLLEKVFNHLSPIEEKIKRIVQEMSFTRFNEKYLGLLNQLNEIKLLKNQELLMNHVSKIIETVIKEGFILPIFQKKYSLYISDKVKDIFVDYYGRPLMQEVRKIKSQ